MYRQANYLLFFLMAAGLAGISMLSACTNDLKKIQEISQKIVNSPADTTRGVDIIYSDSAKVKAHVFAPLMLEYQKDGNTDHMVMPKGIKIIIYDNDKRERGTIVADTAYYLITQQMIQLRKNVVITTIKGDVVKSEEMIYDQFHGKIYTSKSVDVVMANGDKTHGTSFESDDNFTHPNLVGATGSFLSESFGK